MPRQRLDKFLVDQGLVKTRSQALLLIKDEKVLVNGNIADKAAMKIAEDDEVTLTEASHYVGRGALKLKKAIEEFNLNFDKKIVADIGASTGGFTQVSLEYGASKVFAVDVGSDQLALELKNDDRVINLEGTNIRDLNSLDDPIDWMVADLSFISLKLVFENMLKLSHEKTQFILLIKPQFEAGKKKLGKNGIIKDPSIHREILIDLCAYFSNFNYFPQKLILSPILGKTGNKEFLVYLSPERHSSINIDETIDALTS